MCTCDSGYTGDPFTQCSLVLASEPVAPCTPTPCGANAVCKASGSAGSCSCLPDYLGNPYEGCRPECIVNSDCAPSMACTRSKCVDSCPGACGQNSMCQVINHSPTCTCLSGFTGDPSRYCSPVPLISKQSTTQSPLFFISYSEFKLIYLFK